MIVNIIIDIKNGNNNYAKYVIQTITETTMVIIKNAIIIELTKIFNNSLI